MKTYIQTYGRYTLVLLLGLFVGGVSVHYASASVPDSSGSIHGCRNTLTTMLRVIDSASQSCGSDEAALNWDQDGIKAYGRIVYNGLTHTYSLDTSRSKNVTNFFYGTGGDWPGPICFSVVGTPHGVTATSSEFGGTSLKNASGWSDSDYCDSLGSGANVMLSVNSGDTFFFTVF